MIVTSFLIFINVLVYLYFALHSANPLEIDDRYAKIFGINTADFHPWQLITSLFFHFDLPHLGYNMLFLSIFGSKCEKLFGSYKTLIIYFLSGIFADISAFLFENTVSAGSSGAIFGLLGTALIAQRGYYRGGAYTSLVYGLIFFFLTIATGVLAHLLGLIFGFIFGYIMTINWYKEDTKEEYDEKSDEFKEEIKINDNT